jgi:hypothetical protein
VAAQEGTADLPHRDRLPAGQERVPRGAGPRVGGVDLDAGGDRAAGRVVEGAQHARHVPLGHVRTTALVERAQRLPLEVEDHPAGARRAQHLAQVQVAVDPLEDRPVGRDRGLQRAAHRVVPARRRRVRGARTGEALLDLAAQLRACPAAGHRRAEREEVRVQVGDALAQLPRLGREVPPLGRGLDGQVEAVDGVGEELRGQREVAAGGLAVVAPLARKGPGRAWDRVRAAGGQRGGELDVGVDARAEHPEELDDDPGRVLARPGAHEDRGVRLLAAEHAARAGRQLGDLPGGGVDAVDATPARDQVEGGRAEGRVLGSVVDPPAADVVELDRRDEPGVVRDRVVAEGQRHEVGDRPVRVGHRVPDDLDVPDHLGGQGPHGDRRRRGPSEPPGRADPGGEAAGELRRERGHLLSLSTAGAGGVCYGSGGVGPAAISPSSPGNTPVVGRLDGSGGAPGPGGPVRADRDGSSAEAG